ncbi:MAG TPA: hypothetical protein PKY82_33150, partial [Pyrinomonadaceae bacterium]|nr:hypothetical protein [Pyrinomonadaceae bacterium]
SAMLAWTCVEWLRNGKPSVLGAISGAVAGFVGVTPAAGFVTPMSAIIIGLAVGVGCYLMVAEIKHLFGYDDTLDVFGIHGFGGTLGAILTGVFATSQINPIFKDASGNPLPVGLLEGNSAQVLNQLAGIGIAIAFAAIGSFVILKVVDLLIGVRVSETAELEGLDASQHGESGYVFIEDAPSGFSLAEFAKTESAIPTELALESK